MPAVVKFSTTGSFAAVTASRNIAVIAPASFFSKKDAIGTALSSLGCSLTLDAFLRHAKELESPPSGSGCSKFSSITPDGVRLDLFSVTEVCSRNNAPGRPDCMRSAMESLPKKDTNLVVVLLDRSHLLKTAAAIGSALPLFSRKKGGAVSWSIDVVFLVVPASGTAAGSGPAVAAAENCSLRAIQIAQSIMDSVRLAAEMGDTHPEEMSPPEYVRRAQLVTQELIDAGATSISCDVVSGDDLEARGFGGIFNVGKASKFPPALVVLAFRQALAVEAGKTIVLVGKGITYDTGGLALKSRDGMVSMKADNCGAAATLAAFRTIVSQRLLPPSTNLFAVLCLAENCINERAFRNDDIIRLYSGKTIEINNTDAEGRLVLGDGVAFAEKELKATDIVTIATLTGAQGVATGKFFAAVLCSDEAQEQRAVAAGRLSGNMVYPIVYCPELLVGEFTSKVADMKNSVKDRSNAQSSCAGEFIHQQLSSDFKGTFTHFDIASPAFQGERATGFGVAILSLLFAEESALC